MGWFLHTAQLAIVTACITLTITKSKLFEPLRRVVAARSKWFGELLMCPYCTSHWVALGVVLIARQPGPVPTKPLLDVLASTLILVMLAAPCVVAVYKAYTAMGSGKENEPEE